MTRRRSSTAFLYMLLLATVIGAGCSDGPNQPATPENSAPTIVSCDAEPSPVAAGEATTLTVDAVDDDGHDLTYTWSADDGQFPDGTDAESVTWTPPAQMGTYTVTITVDDGTDTAADTIQITVTVPEVDIDPAALDFGADTASLAFTVSNEGDGTLAWSAGDDRDWISLDPAGGDVAAGLGDEVTVTVDRAGLAPGAHTGSVTVTTPYGDGVVSVALIVPAPPALALSTQSLDFGETAVQLPVEITNPGDVTLNWTAATTIGWIGLDPAAGDTGDETDIVQITVDRNGLAVGTHQGLVDIDSDGGDATIEVTLTVPEIVTPPAVALAPLELDFGDATTSLELEVGNAGDGTLAWTATTGASYIDMDPASGEATGEIDKITLTVDRAGLPQGQHTGYVTVSGNGTQETAAIHVTVPGEPPLLTNIFFLHHSTGRNLIDEGSVRAHLDDRDSVLDFWDHDYNHGAPCGSVNGLRDPAGVYLGYDYDIPGNNGCGNTDPDGLHHLWTTSNAARATILADHEVIAFKSCYPASAITSDSLLNQYKQWYLDMRDVFDQYPDKVFVIMSQPPLRRTRTNSTEATRARAFANWLGDTYAPSRSNLVFFDLFDLLAHPDDGSADRNMLREAYERPYVTTDSHPNTLANQTIGPLFADALAAAAGGAR